MLQFILRIAIPIGVLGLTGIVFPVSPIMITAQAALTSKGMVWSKAGTSSNLNLAPSGENQVQIYDTNSGAELRMEWADSTTTQALSLVTRAELQKYLKTQSEAAQNWGASVMPQYKLWSTDRELVSAFSYRLSTAFAGQGLGQGSNTTGHTFRVSSVDQITEKNSIGLNIRYRLTNYRGSSRTDGQFSLGTEFSRQITSSFVAGVEPAFESNASDVDDSAYAGPGLTLSAFLIPNDDLLLLWLTNAAIRRYAGLGVTDTTILTMLSVSYSLRKNISLVVDVSWMKSLSPAKERTYQVFNPLAGVEYHF